MSIESYLSLTNIFTSTLGVIITAFITYVIANKRISAELNNIRIQSNLETSRQDRIYLIKLKIEESKKLIQNFDVLVRYIRPLFSYVYYEKSNEECEKIKVEINVAISNLTILINYFPELKNQFKDLKLKYHKCLIILNSKQKNQDKINLVSFDKETLEIVMESIVISGLIGDKIEDLISKMEKEI